MRTWQVQDNRRLSKRISRPAKYIVDIRSPYSWVRMTAPGIFPACNHIANSDDSTLHFTRMNSVPTLPVFARARMIWFCTCYIVVSIICLNICLKVMVLIQSTQLPHCLKLGQPLAASHRQPLILKLLAL
jgi:hypothetical protein